MHKVLAPVALVVAACGGNDGGEVVQTADPLLPRTEAARPAAPPAVATGVFHDVRMLQTPMGDFVFLPAELTIRQGDAVRWINVSEGPHNVAFYPDRIPPGADRVLAAAIAVPLPGVPLATDLVFEDNAAIEISFAGAPTGTYRYYCTPHEQLGMQATLTIIP